jgi:hypothetical protein
MSRSVTEDPFVAHRGPLVTIAYEMLGSAADTEDVEQDHPAAVGRRSGTAPGLARGTMLDEHGDVPTALKAWETATPLRPEESDWGAAPAISSEVRSSPLRQSRSRPPRFGDPLADTARSMSKVGLRTGEDRVWS